MSIKTKADMFERELQKLYHAELEILDLHKDLAEAAASDEVKGLYRDHKQDTVDQINRIEGIFETLGKEPMARSSQILAGILAEKDEFVWEVENDDLRDLDAIGIGTINERLEITILDRLLLLAEDLDLSPEIIADLEENRSEAESALNRMVEYTDAKRSP